MTQGRRNNQKNMLFQHKPIIVTQHFDVHQNFETPIPGFFIIEARRKITSIAELSEEEQREFIKLLVILRTGMKDVLGIKQIAIYQNESTEWHDFHVWLFPIHPWMEQFGGKIESVKPIIRYAKENMTDPVSLQAVEDAVSKMKRYIETSF